MKKSKKEKPSVKENPDMVGECQDKQKNRERELKPLRIDGRTTILVPKHKCNEEYAEKYRKEKMNGSYMTVPYRPRSN